MNVITVHLLKEATRENAHNSNIFWNLRNTHRMWWVVWCVVCFTQWSLNTKQLYASAWQLSKWSSLFSYWFFIFFLKGKYPQGAPLTLCPPAHSSIRPLSLHGSGAIYCSTRGLLFLNQLLPERWKTSEHLWEVNGLQLAKQIPWFPLTPSHSASERLDGH